MHQGDFIVYYLSSLVYPNILNADDHNTPRVVTQFKILKTFESKLFFVLINEFKHPFIYNLLWKQTRNKLSSYCQYIGHILVI